MSAPIILCDTAGMTNERWLECRAHGPKGTIPYTVGGSDVAAIFGVSPWTTPLELWMIKKGRMKVPVWKYGKLMGADDDTILRAVCLSDLITIHQNY